VALIAGACTYGVDGGPASGSEMGGAGGSAPGAGNQPGAPTGRGSAPGTGSGGSGKGTTNPGAGTSGSGTPSATGGTTSPGSGGSVGNPIHTDPPPVGGELSNCATPGQRLVRRLNSTQFRNTLVAIFNKDASVPTTDIFSDPFTMRFHVDADAPVVRDLDAGLIMDYAETIAAWAVTNNKLGGLSSACQQLNDQNCRKQFIQDVGLKIGREPVSDARVAIYDKLFTANTDVVKTFNDFATDVLTAMFESPSFIYRRELGTSDAGAYKLTPYEVASELSYFLTDGPPDQQLMDAAKNGQLANAAGIDTQASRLLATDSAKKTLAQFVDGWLEIDGMRTKTKDPNVFMLTDELRSAMIQETEETFLDAFDNGANVGQLLTTKRTFVNSALGQFYGLAAAAGDKFVAVDLSGTTRAPGILGQAAYLAQHAQPENSSPIQRGRSIRERLLCASIPEVPKNLNTTLSPPGAFATNRERFQQHDKDPVCAGCHQAFDPVGFAFENFDAFGRYRSEEKDAQGMTHPIDASGTLAGMPEGDIPLNGPQSLIDYLSTSDQVRACLVRYWSYYAHGRDNWPDKKCNDDAVRRESGQNNNSLKSVLMGILHAQTFTRRVQDQ
jgi:hypothetical protein